MNNRFKSVRKAQGLTQVEMADVLGITGSAVSRIEAGQNNITEQNIKILVSKFNVNESWLRTGVGEMFETVSRDEKVNDFFGRLMKDEPASFRRRLINVLSDLNVDQWEALASVAERLVEEYKETKKADPE